MKRGLRRLKDRMRIRVAWSSAEYPKGKVIEVVQVDTVNNKAIVQFDLGSADWFSFDFIERVSEPVNLETPRAGGGK